MSLTVRAAQSISLVNGKLIADFLAGFIMEVSLMKRGGCVRFCADVSSKIPTSLTNPLNLILASLLSTSAWLLLLGVDVRYVDTLPGFQLASTDNFYLQEPHWKRT